MNTKYGRKRASIILNALIFICEIAGFTMEISAEMFVYYTNLSNFTAAVACLLMLLNLFCGFSGRSGNAVWGLKYMATCMTTITLCVVACILVPMQGIQMLYAGNFLVFSSI